MKFNSHIVKIQFVLLFSFRIFTEKHAKDSDVHANTRLANSEDNSTLDSANSAHQFEPVSRYSTNHSTEAANRKNKIGNQGDNTHDKLIDSFEARTHANDPRKTLRKRRSLSPIKIYKVEKMKEVKEIKRIDKINKVKMCECEAESEGDKDIELVHVSSVAPISVSKVKKKVPKMQQKINQASEETEDHLKMELEHGIGCINLTDEIESQLASHSIFKCIINHKDQEEGLYPCHENKNNQDRHIDPLDVLKNDEDNDNDSTSDDNDATSDNNDTQENGEKNLTKKELDNLYKLKPYYTAYRKNVDEFSSKQLEYKLSENLHVIYDHNGRRPMPLRETRAALKYMLALRIRKIGNPLSDKFVQELRNMLYLGDTKYYEGVYRQKCFFKEIAKNDVRVFYLKHHSNLNVSQYLSQDKHKTPVNALNDECNQNEDVSKTIEFKYHAIKQITTIARDMIKKGLVISHFSLDNIAILDNYNVRFQGFKDLMRFDARVVVNHNMELAELFDFSPGRLYDPGITYDHDMALGDISSASMGIRNQFVTEIEDVLSEIFTEAPSGFREAFAKLHETCIEKQTHKRYDKNAPQTPEELLERIEKEYYYVYYRIRKQVRSMDKKLSPKPKINISCSLPKDIKTAIKKSNITLRRKKKERKEPDREEFTEKALINYNKCYNSKISFVKGVVDDRFHTVPVIDQEYKESICYTPTSLSDREFVMYRFIRKKEQGIFSKAADYIKSIFTGNNRKNRLLTNHAAGVSIIKELPGNNNHNYFDKKSQSEITAKISYI